MDNALLSEIKGFSGINNVDPSYRLFPTADDKRRREDIFPLKEAMNVEIDNTYAIKSRPGRDKVLTGSDIHSLWSDGVTCLFVDGTVLYRMDSIYTATAIKTGLTGSAHMSYVTVNDRIYYTNGFQVGYLKDSADNLLTNPGKEYKSPLPAGSLVEYFMGCLFVAVRNILYISDPLCDYFDIRTGYRIFTNDIVMLRAVDNGLYVSDNKVWFIRGKGNDEFAREEVESEAAIPFTDVRTSGESMGYGVSGDVILWTSRKGICIGDSSGVVKNITEDKYIMAEHGRGAAFIREISNVRHYINLLY